MDYVIYLDVFFLINLLMDFLVLIILKKLIHSKANWIRSLIGAIIGAVYICILIVLPFGNLIIFKLITYFVISYFMVRISYNLKGIRNNLKPYALLFVTTFLLGGILNALYFYTKFGYMLKNALTGNLFTELSIVQFIIFTAISFVIIKVILHFVNKLKENSQKIYNVKIEYNNQSFTISALLDTGNSLFEPISCKPVSIIEYSVLKSNLEKINIDQVSFRMIPFKSVGKESGIIPGMCVDQMIIEKGEEKIIVIKPMIGLYDKSLSVNGKYQMLLHPKLLNS